MQAYNAQKALELRIELLQQQLTYERRERTLVCEYEAIITRLELNAVRAEGVIRECFRRLSPAERADPYLCDLIAQLHNSNHKTESALTTNTSVWNANPLYCNDMIEKADAIGMPSIVPCDDEGVPFSKPSDTSAPQSLPTLDASATTCNYLLSIPTLHRQTDKQSDAPSKSCALNMRPTPEHESNNEYRVVVNVNTPTTLSTIS